MKALVLLAFAFAASSAQAILVKGESTLNEYSLTKAGEVLVKTDRVRSQVSMTAKSSLQLVFKGYTKSDVCDQYGESPNGEPEFAPCLKSHPVWSPEFRMEMPVLVSTRIEDVTSSVVSTFSASLLNCIENYDSLISQTEVTAPPARVVVGKCDFIASSEILKPSGKSAVLGGADVVGTLLVMLDSNLKAGGVISNGKADASLQAEIVDASTRLGGSTYGSELIVQATVKSRTGAAVDLFNYGFGIQLK